jgi:hypothetical protein
VARNTSQALADAAWCADCARLGHRCADHAAEAMISGALAEARNRLALTRAEYGELLAAARAAVAAERNGDVDPLSYVRGVLAEHGQLPPPGAVPVHVVADARMALCLTGWSG